MISKILVPLDGSKLSESALPAVDALLQLHPVEVMLFMVGDAPSATVRHPLGPRRPVAVTGGIGAPVSGVIPASPPSYAESKDQAVERREQEMLAYLRQIASRLENGEAAVRPVVRFGDPAREIVRIVESLDIDLIIMSSHGRSGIGEVLFGSVAAAVVRSRVAPVLIVPPVHVRKRVVGAPRDAEPTPGRLPVS